MTLSGERQAHFGDLRKTLFLFEKPLPIESDGTYEYQKVYVAGQESLDICTRSFFSTALSL